MSAPVIHRPATTLTLFARRTYTLVIYSGGPVFRGLQNMKSQRRHELQKNELADWLAGVVTAIKPYQNAILGVVLLVAVAGVVYSWWNRDSAREVAAAGDLFYDALSQPQPDPVDFQDLAEQYPGTKLADWAATMAGDTHLAIGCGQLFDDKAVANQELQDAMDCYTQVCDNTESPTLRERATFGLARALEAQGKDLDKAVERYREVTEKWPHGAYAAMAARRAKDLQRPSTRQMYDRFARFNPKPPTPDLPGGLDDPFSFDPSSLPDDDFRLAPGLTNEKETPTDPTNPAAPDVNATEPDTAAPDIGTPDPTAPEGPAPQTPDTEAADSTPSEPKTANADESKP
ncbi:MAG: hypothetical protein A2V70_12955, partial [Planctomycetes bacterium RBG_13_63_9]